MKTAKLNLNKFTISKISNPQSIIGGNDTIDDPTRVPTQNQGQNN